MSRMISVPAVVCFSFMVSACGGSSASEGSAGPPAGSARAADVSRSACDLISAAEATAIVGSAVVAKESGRGDTVSTCVFAPASGESQEFKLSVQWSGGKEAWDVNQQATALGGKLLGAEKSEATAGVMKADEAQLGDASSYNPILGGYVLKGDVLLEFNNLLTLSDARVKWEKLARTALSRL
jgi:hypothetical protein